MVQLVNLLSKLLLVSMTDVELINGRMNVLHPSSLLFLKEAPLLLVLRLHLPSVTLNLILIHLIDLKLNKLHLTFLVLFG